MSRYRIVSERPGPRSVHHRMFIYVAPDGQDTFALAGVLSFRPEEFAGFAEVLTRGGLEVFELEKLAIPGRGGVTVVTDPTIPPGTMAVIGADGTATRYVNIDREETRHGVPQD